MDKKSAPAYSIANSCKNSLNKQSSQPGPGEYQLKSSIESKFSKNVPKTKDSETIRHSLPAQANITPSMQGVHIFQKPHLPTAMILSRTKQRQFEDRPGPGAYFADIIRLNKSHSSYKLSTASRFIDYSKNIGFVPGPGNYQSISSLSKNKGVGFGGYRKITLGVDPKTPGPGQYSQQNLIDGTKLNPSNFVFGKSKRSQSMNTVSPGPGNYSSNSLFAECKNKNKGFNMGLKLKNTNSTSNNIPGPGKYKFDNAMKKSQHVFTIGKQPKLKLQNQRQFMSKPGIYQYNPKFSTLQKRTVAIGKSKRIGLQTKNQTPGPGNYQLIPLENNLHCSLSKSERKSPLNKNLPGPGQYSPKYITNSQYQRISMTKDHRKIFNVSNNGPGPGNYDIVDKKQGGFSIGHERRRSSKKSDLPGPNMYDIPSTISNLPTYARVSK